MTWMLADGFDIPSWGGFILPLVLALLAGLWFLIKVGVREAGSGELTVELRKSLDKAEQRIADLENDLDEERKARNEEQRQNARDMETLRDQFAQLRTELAVTQAQLAEAYRRQQGGTP